VHTTSLRAHDFELTVDGEAGTIETLFEGFDDRDRLGIVVTSDHGAAGAAALILATVTAFYDRLRSTGEEFFAYPEYFALHVGRRHGSLRKLDIFPEDRELVVSTDPEQIVGALNDHGITRLLVPSRVPRDPRLTPETRARADARIRSALVYSSRGRVLRPNVTVTGSERAEAFVTAMLVSHDADAAAHARRGALRPAGGLPVETFRRIALPGALGMLGSIKDEATEIN
jgi:hypothetical protein